MQSISERRECVVMTERVALEQEVVAITGSNGLLGTKLVELSLRTPAVRPVALSRQPCNNGFLGEFEFHQVDITEEAAVLAVLARIRPTRIIHTAALTDVDGCERDPLEAERVNVHGAGTVAAGAARLGAHLVHLSTEYVFDGRAGPYSEIDEPNPISAYGRSKLKSEAVVLANCPDAAIARTTVLYGYAPNVRPNFATWLIAELSGCRAVRVVDDQVGSPTLADNLAKQCLALSLARASGIYNTVGADVMDRLTFARVAAEVFGLDRDLIAPVSTPSLRQAAARPLRAGLLVDRLRRDFPSVPIMGARDGLVKLRGQLEAAAVWPTV